MVGQFRLQMNLQENCPPRDRTETASGGIIGGPGTATSHFNDVDSATDTHLGLFPIHVCRSPDCRFARSKQPGRGSLFQAG